MSIANPTGSAALPELLKAFGSLVGGLILAGVEPVSAVVLGLFATVVLHVITKG